MRPAWRMRHHGRRRLARTRSTRSRRHFHLHTHIMRSCHRITIRLIRASITNIRRSITLRKVQSIILTPRSSRGRNSRRP